MITEPSPEDKEIINKIAIYAKDWEEREAALRRWAANKDNNASLTGMLLVQAELARKTAQDLRNQENVRV